MDLYTFITVVFCLTDDWLKDKKLCQRGSQPELADSEVLTMEVVGEFSWGSTPRRASRSTFVATTPSGSRPSKEFTAPPSAAKRLISGP